MAIHINGVQQLGVGVENVVEAFAWYRKNFGMDIEVFDEKAVAELMLAHTEGKTRERRAILALNMQGGGGFEIWQHTGKTPAKPKFEVELGDLGICIGKMKTANAEQAHAYLKTQGVDVLTSVQTSPNGVKHFFAKDIYGNSFDFVEDTYIFQNTKAICGGAFGAIIGVKSMEESLPVYQDILGYSNIDFDVEDVSEDFNGIKNGDKKFRRVQLSRPQKIADGAFSPLFGPSVIELVEAKETVARDIFEGRIWGDPGFIHLCFDINGMSELREDVKAKGFPFTVDSEKALGGSFDMGDAGGSFSYIQAPEGTLIEFVETHKVPLVEKFNISIDLTKRERKPLPMWMLKAFRFKRVK